jgi:hypothetical protein
MPQRAATSDEVAEHLYFLAAKRMGLLQDLRGVYWLFLRSDSGLFAVDLSKRSAKLL